MAKIEIYTSIGTKTIDTDDYIYVMCDCMEGFILHKKDKGKQTKCSNCSGKNTHYIQNVCLFCINNMIPDGHHDEPDWCDFYKIPTEDVFKQTQYEIVDKKEQSGWKTKVYRERMTLDIPRNGCISLETNLQHPSMEENNR